ncbi:MAG: ABC transporter permease [Planctomycetota bacterium]|jgi:peptide/nickel transport system permease protein
MTMGTEDSKPEPPKDSGNGAGGALPGTPEEPVGISLWADAWRRLKRDRIAMVCFAVIILYLLVGVGIQVAGWTGALDVGAQDLTASHKPPSAKHPFGTNVFGQSVLLRGLWGVRVALLVGVLSSLIAIPIGVVLGAIAGYFGGKVDEVVVWFYTTFASIPGLLLILAWALVLGKGMTSVIAAIGFTNWVAMCRLIRGEVLKHRGREYVLAAKALGAGNLRAIFLHILPNVLHLVIINFSLMFVYAVKSEVILSFLGVGVVGEPSWGVMIDEAKQELFQGVWWQLGAATFFMFGIILAFNVFGDALRDALDPKLRQ